MERQEHRDGHGLADRMEIVSDERDGEKGGGASHRYAVYYTFPDGQRVAVAEIQFQHGPRDVDGSQPGILDSVLVAILLDRLRAFQAGPYPSRQNAIIITKLEESLMWMKNRADERAERGVLGKNEK